MNPEVSAIVSLAQQCPSISAPFVVYESPCNYVIVYVLQGQVHMLKLLVELEHL